MNDDDITTDRGADDRSGDNDADKKLLAKAKERFKKAKEYWDRIYGPMKEDLEFYGGDQWPVTVLQSRNTPGEAERPALTINRLPQFHNQIVNDYRQATISMRAQPQGTEDDNVARTYQGMFRQIEKQSHAQVAYISALSIASIVGLNYIRVLTRFADDKSFDQDIFIDRCTGPFKHYPDPDATGFFLEDADYWFINEKLSNTDYKDLYGDKENAEDWDSDVGEDWGGDDYRIVAEYFYFTTKYRELLLLGDGTVGFKDEMTGTAVLNIKKTRKVPVKTLNWCKIDGANVLERSTWATNRIPVVPIWGNELWIDEKRKPTGFVNNAKDSCKQYNFMESKKTEMIALAPIAPYIAAEGQLEGHEDEWKKANTTPKAALLYKPISVDGTIVPAPQRQSYEAPVQAIIQASRQASDDMKATIGLYDASLGQKSNETSGIAIQHRQREGDTATYNFVDNLALGVGYVGLIVGELIPVIYDTERQIRIIGEDQQPKMVTVNKKMDDGTPHEQSPQIADIKYDLILDTGPSFASLREETTKMLVDLSHNFPKLMDVAGDIAIGNMSFQGAQEIAARLKRTIPPEVVGPDEDPITKLHAAETQLQQGMAAMKLLQTRVAELEKDVTEKNLLLKNKSGEIKIKLAELDIKKQEMQAQIDETDNADQNGKDHTQNLEAVMHGIIHLGAQMETMQEMLLNAVAEEQGGEPAPETSTEPNSEAPPEVEAPAPEAPTEPPAPEPQQ